MKRLSIPLLLTLLLIPLAFGTRPAGAGDDAGPATCLQGHEAGARFLPDGKTPVFAAAFKENIEYRVNNDIITGIVIGVVTPRGTSFYSCGVKSLATNEPVDEHTVFEIGSNTKTFTGILLAQEVVGGGLSLDDPLQKLLPAGITAPTRNGQSINLVHLANHTSSLPRMPDSFVRVDPGNPYAQYTEKQAYDFLPTYELPRDIGTEFEYSNYGMGLLGIVLASRNGSTYEELMVRNIADPLGMAHTRIVLTPDMEQRLAKGHKFGIEVENWDFLAVAGAGAIRSSAVDMLRYLAANMGLTSSELLPAMELSHEDSGGTIGEMTIGLGWIKTPVDGGEIVWHDGGTGGYMSFMGFAAGDRKGVVVLTNSQSFPDDIGFHLLNPESELANPKPSIATVMNRIAENDGIDSAVESYAELKLNSADNYDFGESELNELGYMYLWDGKTREALAIFETNTEAYPESWAVYDSYGEALLENNETEKAIANYRKSIELNPENSAGIGVLEKLGVDFP